MIALEMIANEPTISACRLEVLEAGNCTLLACTLAWHPEAHGSFGSFHAAARDAQEALGQMGTPAAATAPAIQVCCPC